MGEFYIKHDSKRRIILSSSFLVAITLIVISGCVLLQDQLSANANPGISFGYDDELPNDDSNLASDNNHIEEEPTELYYRSGCIGGEYGLSCSGVSSLEPDEYFVAKYDSSTQRDCPSAIGCVSNQENQRNENLCWAYSYTTAIESSLMRQSNVHTELSVKQLDYLLSDNFSDISNPYYNHLKTTIGFSRTITNPSNFTFASIISTGKYALVTENSFWSKLQNSEQGLYDYDNYASYLSNNTSGYRQKIASTNALNDGATKYILDSYESVTGYIYYGEEKSNIDSEYYDKEALIRHLKDAIKDYGSIAIGTHYDEANCAYVDKSADTYTYIDRTTRENKNICANGHAIALIGWDDTWEYIDNGEQKKGAFIVRNSYGEQSKKEYFAYDSAITSFFIAKNIEENVYDNNYDYIDYKGSYTKDNNLENGYRFVYNSPNGVIPEDNELIYEFETENDKIEKLEKITFSQRIRMAGARYNISVSTDDGQSWRDVGDVVYYYPGQQEVTLDENVYVSGRFIVKVKSGLDWCKGDEIVVCLPYLKSKSYVGEKITDTEKKYNYVNVFTSDYSEPEEKEEYTIAIHVNNSAYGTVSHNSINAPKNSYLIVNDNQLLLYDENDLLIETIVATPINENERHSYEPVWSFNGKLVINSDKDITILFKEQEKTYSITFAYYDKNGQLSTLLNKNLIYGAMPEYEYDQSKLGPSQRLEPDDPNMEYVFTGWDKELAPVTGDAVYIAQFSLQYRQFTITFQNCDNENVCTTLKSLKVEYNQIPIYNDIVPQKDDDENYTYEFLGWDREVAPATEDATYTAIFFANPKNKDTDNDDDGKSEDLPNEEDNNDENNDQEGEDLDIPTTGGVNDENNQNHGGSGNKNNKTKVADTGYAEYLSDIKIKADSYVTMLTMGVIGFIIFIVKNRNKAKE